jgi:hypothetical protein
LRSVQHSDIRFSMEMLYLERTGSNSKRVFALRADIPGGSF